MRSDAARLQRTSEWRCAELWLTLCYDGVFWLALLRLVARRDSGGMEAAVVPAGFALVRVLVGVAKGRYGRGGSTND